ncbi:MAG: DUF169 domain-containing protein [Candidatus Krumholzibacteriota bacterium]|nr:DUF169 domain-containing protein [Candidatus Krumholzibacteriota bacterium]
MQPDSTELIEKIGLRVPLIGFYDAPDTAPFEPLVEPGPGKHACVFAFYRQWLAGKTLHITKDNFGCPGAGHWLFSAVIRSREDLVKFLTDDEGLKSSHGLMNQWLDHNMGYKPKHPHLLVGPLREGQYEHLNSVTFYVDPDQLSALMTGAQYHSAPGDPLPVIAPFGSGCMQLISPFEDLSVPQAVVGATDIAMRQYLEPELVAFTVTKPMFEQLCGLGSDSFLYKRFWKNLVKARGGIERI